MITPPLIGFLSPEERNAYLLELLSKFKDMPHMETSNWHQRRIELGKEVCKRKLIYLDTNYWIYLREVVEGKRTNDDYAQLLDRLRELVKSGIALCPLADAAFLELMRQTEPRRSTTARIMDELSQGVCLQVQEQRIRSEIQDFIVRARNKTVLSSRHPRDQVWTKCSHVIGDLAPYIQDLPPDLVAVMQRLVDETLCSLRLEEIVEALERVPPDLFRLDHHSDQNLNKNKHIEEVKSYEQVFQGEMENALLVFSGDIEEIFSGITGIPSIELGQQVPSPVNILINIMTEGLRKNPNIDILPTLRVAAAIHAAHWMDARRKYEAHDAEDIMHAEAALPYCDFFLTEKSLAHMISTRPVKLADFFGTKVCSNAREALDALAPL